MIRINTIQFIKSILVHMFILHAGIVFGQGAIYTCYKIGLIGESTPFLDLVKDKYEKEFYYNENNTVYIKRQKDDFELYIYDSKKILTEIYLKIDTQLYVLEKPVLIDESWNELSEEEKKSMPDFWKIYRDEKKAIGGFNCFKVILKDPEDTEGNSTIEMYVTEQLPNLPIHHPLPEDILSAEPLEINVDLMGSKISFGIVNREEGLNILSQIDINPEAAQKIDQATYDKLKSEY